MQEGNMKKKEFFGKKEKTAAGRIDLPAAVSVRD
jgi:hypothetical protein